MKKKHFGAFLGVFILLPTLLSGCGETPSSSSNQTSSPSSSTITSEEPIYVDPPAYEEPSISFHYHRNDGEYDDWALWLWEPNAGEGEELTFNGQDEYGAIAAYPLSHWTDVATNGLGFIVKNKSPEGGTVTWVSKDPDGDRFIDLNNFEIDENDIYHVYLMTADPNIYINADLEQAEIISSAVFNEVGNIHVETTVPVSSYRVYQDGNLVIDGTNATPRTTWNIIFANFEVTPDFRSLYEVEVTFAESSHILKANVSNYGLYRMSDFAENYTYNGDDLGATYTPSKTTFKVWSPTSKTISLRIYENGTPEALDETIGSDEYLEYPMTLTENGVWTAEVSGDLAGSYYTYFATSNTYPLGREVVDPYAKSAGLNGLRGQIVDFEEINSSLDFQNLEIPHYDRKELVVYELHIADLTSDETWGGPDELRATYEGFALEGTNYQGVKTGFDHLKEMNINAVQILPFFDQANEERPQEGEDLPAFNWGYNPLNYNVLEGSYSSDPTDGYQRIIEFKKLVKTYAEAGISIIMDVVYNHVNGATGSNFDVLCPGYYFRANNDGSLNNASGCGNVVASELPMVRKFIVDSASFWAEEYKLGGFRFDLMGCIDMETMHEVSVATKEINSSFAVYGEPWTGGTDVLPSSEAALQSNARSWDGYGGFNDQMRDALIAGGLSAPTDRAWVSTTSGTTNSTWLNKIALGSRGITYLAGQSQSDPDKTVNYVTCHDNYTLYDRFYYGNEIEDEETVKKMALLAESVALLSQGTSFMQGGEEFLRSKGGDSNSYQSGYDVNAFHYDLLLEHSDLAEAMRTIIALKTSNPLLHLNETQIEEQMTVEVEATHIEYRIVDDAGNYLHFAARNGHGTADINIDFSGEEILLDTNYGGGGEISFDPFQIVISSNI